MTFGAKIFPSLFFLFLHCAGGFAQGPSDVEIFQSFFKGKHQESVEVALLAATTRLHQAVEANDPLAKTMALQSVGLLHLTRTHDYEKAMGFLILSLANADSLHFNRQQTLAYVGIARVFEVVGDQFNSARFLEQALKLNDDDNDIHILVMILNDLGKVNASLGRLEEAFQNYKDVLKFKGDIDRRVEAEALFNLGHLYTIQGKYNEALRSHKEALSISRIIHDKGSEARSLNDIGEVYQLMQNEEKSLANHIVALELRQALKEKRGIAQSYNNIGLLYYQQKNIEQAIDQAMLALENARESQDQEQIFESYELLSQSYKALGNFEKALDYKELSVAIKEFRENERSERQLLETQNRYMLSKKENQIEKLEALRLEREKQIEAQTKIKNFLIALISLSLVIAVLILFLYIFKRRSNLILQAAKDEVQRQNQKLQELNATKDKFFSIISHDLKGPLNSLTSFSRLLIDHTDNMSKEDIQMLAKDLDKSVKNLFALLENLLEWSRSQTGNIDFTPEVFDIAGILDQNKSLFEPQAMAKNINLTIGHNPSCLVKVHRDSINTVVRNFVSNAIKFTNTGGNITLDLQLNSDRIMISVTDTGLGMSQEVVDKLFRLDKKYSTSGTANEKGTGLGLIICIDFVEKNGGRLHVKSEPGKGSVFSFTLPQMLSNAVIGPNPKSASFVETPRL